MESLSTPRNEYSIRYATQAVLRLLFSTNQHFTSHICHFGKYIQATELLELAKNKSKLTERRYDVKTSWKLEPAQSKLINQADL